MVARFKALSLKGISSFFPSAPRRRRRRAAKRNVRTNTTISIQQLESRAMLSAVTAADIEAVRDQLLDGVSSIHSGVQPGHVAAFGDSAFGVANYPDASDGTLIAASLHGEGKIVAVPDHQMLLMGRWADTGDSTAFYNNTVEWLAGSSDLDASALDANVVTLSQDNADWLTSQGYTDVSVASTSTLAGDLADADVFVAGWLGHAVSDATLDTIDAFVTDGGGLFIAEYGQGYDWWWAGEVSDAPANRLLRDAGIGFGSGFEWYSDAVDVHRATTDISAREMFDVIENRSDYTLAEKIDAAHVATTVLEALPETHPIFQQTETVLSSLTASISATPATPVTDAFDQAALIWEAGELASTPANEVVAHHTAESVYGAIPADAEAVTQTVTIDLSQAEPLLERHSTGLYAAPGQQVTITVPTSAAGQGLKIRLNNHTDDISGQSTWSRVPSGISRTFSIDNTTTTVAGAFGGHIYLEAPAGTEIGNIDVTISGAIEAPYFVLGEDTNADWIDSIRDNPAPYAELSSGNVIISLPSSMIRDLENPEELMTYWRDVVYAQDYLAGTHEDRTRAERINIDVQISHGYLHAGYATQGPLVAAPEIVDLALLNESGSWGWFHELGHEHQEGPSTISGDTEVTVNLFTLYAYDAVGVSHERHTATHRIGQTQSLLGNGETYSDGGAFEKLAFYQQIQAAFGWEPFEQFYRSYRDGSDLNAEFGLPSNNQEEIDQWLTRLSVLTGRDLSPHFDAWGFGVTQSARDAVAHLPQWSMIETLSETESVTVAEDRSNVSFDLSDNVFGLVGNGDLSFTVIDQPENGTLTDNGDGTFSFAPAANVGGTETVTVAAVNEQGGRAEIEVTIDTPSSTRFNRRPGFGHQLR